MELEELQLKQIDENRRAPNRPKRTQTALSTLFKEVEEKKKIEKQREVEHDKPMLAAPLHGQQHQRAFDGLKEF